MESGDSVFVYSGALHGIEVSLLAVGSLLGLRSAIRRVIWFCRQCLAKAGAVLCLLDGPHRCDPAYCVVLVSCSHDSEVSCLSPY